MRLYPLSQCLFEGKNKKKTKEKKVMMIDKVNYVIRRQRRRKQKQKNEKKIDSPFIGFALFLSLSFPQPLFFFCFSLSYFKLDLDVIKQIILTLILNYEGGPYCNTIEPEYSWYKSSHTYTHQLFLFHVAYIAILSFI